MLRLKFTPRFAIGVFFVLAGTTSVIADSLPIIDLLHGAKRGTIIQVYDVSAAATTLPPCLASLSQTDRANRTFAEIEYRHIRHMFREVGELPAGFPKTPGTEVEIYPKDCDLGTISRVTRLLK